MFTDNIVLYLLLFINLEHKGYKKNFTEIITN